VAMATAVMGMVAAATGTVAHKGKD